MSNIGMPPAWSRFGDGAAAGRGWGHESQPGGRMTTGTPPVLGKDGVHAASTHRPNDRSLSAR